MAEAALFALFAALSMWMVALSVWQVVRAGAIWTGTDGIFVQDQMQYLAWIRDASRHGLTSNLYSLESGPHDYLQPAIAISAGLTALGVAPWLTLLLWKPVGVASVFLGVRAVVHRTVEGDGARLAALTLAMLFTGWGALMAGWLGGESLTWDAISNEAWLGFWSWGYPFGLIGLAAALGALVAYARDRAAGRITPTAPLLGALASWLHPWQGELLAVIVIGTEALLWALVRRRPPARLALVTLIGAALPLVYYAVLGRTDESWRLAQQAGNRHWALWMVAVSILPLLLPAALAYRNKPATFLEAAIRVWPGAALIVFLVAQTPRASGALHAVLGISIPLAILAVEGVRSLRWRVLTAPPAAALAVVVLVAPPVVYELRQAHRSIHLSLERDLTGSPRDAKFLEPDTRDALHWLLGDPRSGGVLTRAYLGTAVPAETGRATWVGNSYWSGGRLGFFFRDGAANALFFGGFTAAEARRLVRNSGARFVLADCHSRPRLPQDLADLVRETKTFGCAKVLVLRRPG